MPVIGFATLPIVPSLDGAGREIIRQMQGLGADSARSFSRSFGSNVASQAADALKSAMSGATVAAVGLSASLAVVGTNFNALEQQSRAALKTLLGSTEAANEQMSALNDLVQTSPYGKDVFIKAQQQLIGFGLEAKKALPYIDAVQQAVAASGGSSQTLSEITYVMSQIQAAGKVTAVDLMQLGQRGIDAAGLIGGSLGKSGAEIRESITAGTLGAGEALDALVAGMNEKFGGAADNVKNTWLGVTQRIGAQWRNLGSELAEPFVSKAGGGMAVEWAGQIGDILVSLRKKVGPIWSELMGEAAPFFDKVSQLLDRIKVKIDGFDGSGLVSLFGKIGDYGPAIAAVGAGFAAMTAGAASSIPVLGQLLPAINPFVAAIGGLLLSSPEVREALGGMFDAVMDQVKPLLPLLGEFANIFRADIAPVIAQVVTALQPLVNLLGGTLRYALIGLNAVLPYIADALSLIANAANIVLAPLGGLDIGFGSVGDAADVSAEQMARVSDASKDIIGTIGNLSSTLDENTAAFTKNTAEQILNGLAKTDINGEDVTSSGMPSALATLNKLGLDRQAILKATLGDVKDLNSAYGDLYTKQSALVADRAGELGLATQFKDAGLEGSLFMDTTRDNLERAQELWHEYWQATGGNEDDLNRLNLGYQLISEIPGITEDAATAQKLLQNTWATGNATRQTGIEQMVTEQRALGELGEARLAIAQITQQGTENLGDNARAILVTAEQYGKLSTQTDFAGMSAADFVAQMQSLGYASYATDAALLAAVEGTRGLSVGMEQAAASSDLARDAVSSFLDKALQIRSSISDALTGFINPVGAWEKATQKVQDSMRKAYEAPKRTRQGDDPAVLAAKAAVDAGRKIKEAAVKSAGAQKDESVKAAKAIKRAIDDQTKAEMKAAKDAEDAAQRRVDAAKKEASEYQKLADQKKAAAQDAEGILEDAEFRARAAEASVAAAKLGLDNADPSNRTQWERNYKAALEESKAATSALSLAQADYKTKTEESGTATQAAKTAVKEAETAEKDLATAKDGTATASEESSARQQQAADDLAAAQEAAALAFETAQENATLAYDILVDQKNAADERSRASSETAATGISDAMSGMIEEVKPSFADYLTELEGQVTAQETWKDDMVELAGKVSTEAYAELLKLGPAYADAVHLAKDQTQPELDRLSAALEKSGADGVVNAVAAIVNANPDMIDAGAGMATSILEGLRTQLGGKYTDEEIKAMLSAVGIQIQDGLDGAQPTVNFKSDLVGVYNDLRWFSANIKPIVIPFKAGIAQDMSTAFFPNGKLPGMSDGGWITGGSGTKDDVLLAGMGGEFVSNKKAAAKNGPLLEYLNAGGDASLWGNDGAKAPAATMGNVSNVGTQGGVHGMVVNNYYPQAEPTSVTVNRAMQHAADLVEFG